MKVSEILLWARRQPFQPFEVVLESGTRVPVSHPEEIFFLPKPEQVWHIEVFAGERVFLFGPTAVTAIESMRAESMG